MIPKIIHYCWFSNEKQNRFIRNCIKSWKKVMPDYEIKCWDANSFDFNSIPFVKEAYNAKVWAFVADYIRIYALYTYGGIYLDSDVKTFRRFDNFLKYNFFIGTEPLGDGTVELESAIMGSEPHHPYLKDCLNYYNSLQFINTPEFKDKHTCPRIMSYIMEKYGYKYINKSQFLKSGIQVLDLSFFGHCWGCPQKDYYAIHYFNASWLNIPRGRLYTFCKKNDYMEIYIKITKMTQRLFRKNKSSPH